MQLLSLYLHNFRRFEEAFFEFGPRFNVICGANAKGKTSLLEAVYFLIAGKSFRGANTNDLIRRGASFFYLEAHFRKNEIDQTLRVSFNGQERKYVYNHTSYSSAAQLMGILQGVVSSPDDASLIKGAPQARRAYLDMQIAQVDPLYVHHLTRYTRALKQRNCLLRGKQLLTLGSWEHEMACSASYLMEQRRLAVNELLNPSRLIHSQLAGEGEELSLIYKSAFAATSPESILEQYRKDRRREMEIGCTLTGPHKDDLVLSIGGQDARQFASEGQQRTCASALRLAEWDRLRSLSTGKPLILVDDIGMGLDEKRKESLSTRLIGCGQVFLTAALFAELPSHKDTRIINM